MRINRNLDILQLILNQYRKSGFNPIYSQNNGEIETGFFILNMNTSEDYFWSCVKISDVEKSFWQNIGLNTQVIKFWNKVEIGKPEECWNWKAGTDSYNYGSLKTVVDGKTWHRANRLAFYLHFQVDPGDLNVCHTCDNSLCTNPNHFFLGTQLDNIMDFRVKNGLNSEPTVKHPEDKKLLENDVKNIRYLIKNKLGTCKNIAKVYRVSIQTILAIKQNKTWK